MFGVVVIDYTNWKGERAPRLIQPLRLYFGANEWHKQEQFLLEAIDMMKKDTRTFAMQDIHAWRPVTPVEMIDLATGAVSTTDFMARKLREAAAAASPS